jgi:hypothetical protein
MKHAIIFTVIKLIDISCGPLSTFRSESGKLQDVNDLSFSKTCFFHFDLCKCKGRKYNYRCLILGGVNNSSPEIVLIPYTYTPSSVIFNNHF